MSRNAVFDPSGKLKNTRLSPEQIPDDAWTLDSVSTDGTSRRYYYYDEASQLLLYKVENLIEDDLLELNRQQYNDSIGKRWGDGRVAARLPMNIYMREFAARRREGDNDFAKWWLNRSENQKFRTFKGTV